MNLALEFCLLAGKIGGVILLGKGHMDSHFLLADLVQQLLLEAGDEHAAAQNQRLVLSGAAGELDTVTEACVIQNHLVTVLGGAVGHNSNAGILLAQTLQLTIHFRIGHNMTVTGGTEATVSKTHKNSPFICHSS